MITKHIWEMKITYECLYSLESYDSQLYNDYLYVYIVKNYPSIEDVLWTSSLFGGKNPGGFCIGNTNTENTRIFSPQKATIFRDHPLSAGSCWRYICIDSHCKAENRSFPVNIDSHMLFSFLRCVFWPYVQSPLVETEI